LATDVSGGISYQNDMPWKFDLDTQYYKDKITTNSIFPGIIKNILIMGYTTFTIFYTEPMNNVVLYVITSRCETYNKGNTDANVIFINNFEEVITLVKQRENKYSDVWVIGGKKIYEYALSHPMCHKIFLTQIEAAFPCDLYIDLSNYDIIWKNEIIAQDTNKIDNTSYNLTFKEGLLCKNNFIYSENEELPIEILEFYTNPQYVETFLKVDYEVWTKLESVNELYNFPFVSKEVWLDKNNPGKITIIHIWKSIELWKLIDNKEFQNKCITEFEKQFNHPYKFLTNSHDVSFWSKYRYSRYESI